MDYVDVGQVPEIFNSSVTSYVTSDLNSDFSGLVSAIAFDASRFLESDNRVVRIAFTDENPYGLPIVTCSNATSLTPVVTFNPANLTSVTTVDSCSIISFDSEDSLRRIHDKIMYRLLGAL